MRDNEFTKILGWPGYRVFRHEIDETAKTLRLWVRRKRGNRKLICSGCGRKISDVHDFREREVRDLPWGEYRTTVVSAVYRMCCPQCGVRVEKVPQLPSKAPFSKRFEEAMECHASPGAPGATGRGRDLLRQADEIHYRGQQLGERRALVVRTGPQAR